jgi:hypothetical protein
MFKKINFYFPAFSNPFWTWWFLIVLVNHFLIKYLNHQYILFQRNGLQYCQLLFFWCNGQTVKYFFYISSKFEISVFGLNQITIAELLLAFLSKNHDFDFQNLFDQIWFNQLFVDKINTFLQIHVYLSFTRSSDDLNQPLKLSTMTIDDYKADSNHLWVWKTEIEVDVWILRFLSYTDGWWSKIKLL